MKEKIIISSCLLGNNCKYNGTNNCLKTDVINKLKEKYALIPVCPECMGNLNIPRFPSEIKGKIVVDKFGTDVTEKFYLGASRALKIINKYKIKIAILKESSPSCGVNFVYDGSFSGGKIEGMGITARLLLDNGVKLFNEQSVSNLIK